MQTEDVQKKISDISKTLEKFKVVVDQCFGVKLFPGYILHAIEEFCSSYRLLHNITFPTKYHIVETHIVQYLDRRGDGTKGLGYWSEQAMESCHHDFKELAFILSVNYVVFSNTRCSLSAVGTMSPHLLDHQETLWNPIF